MDQRKQINFLIPTTIPLILIILSFFEISKITTSSQPAVPNYYKKHFVLVHGSCHGAWSWYKIVTLIRSSGHDVNALDLAGSGIDPQQANNLHSISDYFKPLSDFMEALPQHKKVILVGHSLGGLAISQAMERFQRKISVAVFVAALMPGPNLNISTLQRESFRRQESQMDSRFTYDKGTNNPPTTFIFGPLYLAAKVYQLSPKEDVDLATMLMRPLSLFGEEDMSMQLKLSNERYGSVNRVYIISDEDLVGRKDFQKWMVERNQPNRVVEIRGSDHMVMMSKPLVLWAHLQIISENYS